MQALDHDRTSDRVERFENGTELACCWALFRVLRSIQVAASGIDIGLLDLVFPRDRAKVSWVDIGSPSKSARSSLTQDVARRSGVWIWHACIRAFACGDSLAETRSLRSNAGCRGSCGLLGFMASGTHSGRV